MCGKSGLVIGITATSVVLPLQEVSLMSLYSDLVELVKPQRDAFLVQIAGEWMLVEAANHPHTGELIWVAEEPVCSCDGANICDVCHLWTTVSPF